MGEFSDKVVLVTGGATGIGKAAALAFARRGATVVIAGRRRRAGEAAAVEIANLGATAKFIETDVARPEQVDRLHGVIASDYGRLDVAFNNAAYREPRAPVAEQDPRLYDRVFDTNLRAVYLSLQHQIRIMEEQGGGAIIMNSSVYTTPVVANNVLYISSRTSLYAIAAQE